MKTVLVVGAGRYQRAVIRRARELGLRVVAVDRNPDAPGLRMADVPLLPAAEPLARAGHVTGASARNWTSFGADVQIAPGIAQWQRNLLSDPQTSGGLLVACSPESAGRVVALFREAGFEQAAAIGEINAGSPRIVVQ